MKVTIGVRKGHGYGYGYVYRGMIEVPVDHKFTVAERLVMDRIIVYDDSVWLALDWNRHWQDDGRFVLEYIRLPNTRIKVYTKRRCFSVKMEGVLMTSSRILTELASIIQEVARNKGVSDGKVVKRLRKEVLKILFGRAGL